MTSWPTVTALLSSLPGLEPLGGMLSPAMEWNGPQLSPGKQASYCLHKGTQPESMQWRRTEIK